MFSSAAACLSRARWIHKGSGSIHIYYIADAIRASCAAHPKKPLPKYHGSGQGNPKGRLCAYSSLKIDQSQPKRERNMRSKYPAFILLAVLTITANACGSQTTPALAPAAQAPAAAATSRPVDVPSNLDYSTTRISDKSLFRVSYTASTGTVLVNQIHQWTLHVETADGRPVENADINVDGDMPQHGHGLPTQPRVTKYLGNGDYLVDGLKFQMGGWWLMDFTITANGQTDVVHFNMMLH